VFGRRQPSYRVAVLVWKDCDGYLKTLEFEALKLGTFEADPQADELPPGAPANRLTDREVADDDTGNQYFYDDMKDDLLKDLPQGLSAIVYEMTCYMDGHPEDPPEYNVDYELINVKSYATPGIPGGAWWSTKEEE
jgi:hypothetical protein